MNNATTVGAVTVRYQTSMYSTVDRPFASLDAAERYALYLAGKHTTERSHIRLIDPAVYVEREGAYRTLTQYTRDPGQSWRLVRGAAVPGFGHGPAVQVASAA